MEDYEQIAAMLSEQLGEQLALLVGSAIGCYLVNDCEGCCDDEQQEQLEQLYLAIMSNWLMSAGEA